MQSTIFDYSLVLRYRDRETYISKSHKIVMVAPYKVVNMRRRGKEFYLASSTSEEGVQGTVKSPLFNMGMSGYGPIFALSADKGFNYSPTVLIRKSLYDGIIIGRLYTEELGFIGRFRTIIVRPYLFQGISVNIVPKVSRTDTSNIAKMESIFEYSEAGPTTKIASPEITLSGRVSLVSKYRYSRIISFDSASTGEEYEYSHVSIKGEEYGGIIVKVMSSDFSSGATVYDSFMSIRVEKTRYEELEVPSLYRSFISVKKKEPVSLMENTFAPIKVLSFV